MHDWPDARVAELLGGHLAAHTADLGRIDVNQRRVGVRGPGWTVELREVPRHPATAVEVTVQGHPGRWVVHLDAQLDQQVAAVADQLLPVLRHIRQNVTEQSLRPGDRLTATATRWGIRRGATFTVVQVISHRGHDPVTTYELDGPGVPRHVEVPHGDLPIGEVWRRA